jgi:hypothetical protein
MNVQWNSRRYRDTTANRTKCTRYMGRIKCGFFSFSKTFCYELCARLRDKVAQGKIDRTLAFCGGEVTTKRTKQQFLMFIMVSVFVVLAVEEILCSTMNLAQVVDESNCFDIHWLNVKGMFR